MRTETDEAKKVLRAGGKIFHAVFRRIGDEEIDQLSYLEKILLNTDDLPH